jgi:glycine cleavage system H protein
MADEAPEGLKYSKSHEWLKINGSNAIIGITDYAQTELTDIVYVELPEIGKKISKGDELCVIESVKSVSEIYAPISGKIIKINHKLEDEPETINNSPYDEGWLVEIELINKEELNGLLDAESYKKLLSKA